MQSEHTDTACTKMFQLWLSKQPPPTWNQLITSLKQPDINLNQLAAEIEQKLLEPHLEGMYVITQLAV